MVHGASQDRRVFGAQLPAFRDAFRLLLVDLPGHGASGAMPGPFGPAEYAAAVHGAIAAAGIVSMHYWGTHTGAGVGLQLAAREPARFASLVLEGALMPGANPPSVIEALERARRTARTRGLEAAREEWFERSGWFRRMRDSPRRLRAAEHLAMVSEFACGPWLDDSTPAPVSLTEADLAAIRAPALLLNGEHDLPDFLAQAEALLEALPCARRELVPGAGGFPLWEYPQEVAASVRRFLLRAAGAPSG
jgi:3-oxoadipate enol-lactonase/4-carboxymuconolactone decarboxylase